MDPVESKSPDFYVNEETLELIIETILTKLKANGAVLSRAAAESIWDKIVEGLIAGDLGENEDEVGTKAVPLELLAEMVLKGQFLKYKLVTSDDEIDTAVEEPEYNTVYLLKSTEDDSTSASIWMYMKDEEEEDYWLEIGAVEVPELKTVDTTSDESVQNIVSHVERADKDYSGSQNVKADDLVTAQALTNVLIALGYSKKVTIPYTSNEGKAISEYIPSPAENVFYVYQQSDSDEDWAVYVAIKTGTDSTKTVWLKLAGGEGSVEVDLSNYWSKDELQAITKEKVQEIFETVDAKLFPED